MKTNTGTVNLCCIEPQTGIVAVWIETKTVILAIFWFETETRILAVWWTKTETGILAVCLINTKAEILTVCIDPGLGIVAAWLIETYSLLD